MITQETAKRRLNEIVGDREMFVIKHNRTSRSGYLFSVLCADENGKIHDVGNFFAVHNGLKLIDPDGNTHGLWMMKANPGYNLTDYVNECWRDSK